MLPHPAQQIVLQEYLQTVNERMARLERLSNELQHFIKEVTEGSKKRAGKYCVYIDMGSHTNA